MSQLYQPLDPASVQIRLISFEAGDEDSTSGCRLERYSLLTAPQYNALSYCWGDENVTTDILVNGLRISVTSNLAAALCRARELDPGQRLWADALCINQADDHEKSQQVGQMKYIYERAEVTYAWLAGSPMHQSSFLWQSQQSQPHQYVAKLVENIRTTSLKEFKSAQHASSITGVSSLSACQALFEIVQNEYWRRRWIIQELVTARQVRVTDQHHVVALEDLMTALQRWSESDQWTTQYKMASKHLREILAFRQDYLEERSLKLCTAIFRTKEYLSRDVRDRVFALIGVCSDGQELVPLPNYHQNRDEITRDMTRKCILRNVNLEIIFVAASAASSSASRPSWAPDWLSSDLSDQAQEIANAAREYPRMLANLALRAELNVLKVQGITFGRIVRNTGPLVWQYARVSNHVCDCNVIPERGSMPSYYLSHSQAGYALQDRLLPFRANYYATYGMWRVHCFVAGLLRAQHQCTPGHNEAYEAYSQWIWNHRSFTIDGKRVDELLQRRRVLRRLWLVPIFWILFASVDGWLFYTSIKSPWASPKVTICLPLAILVSLSILIVAMAEGGNAVRVEYHFKSDCQRVMRDVLDASLSLVRLDNGSIGMASGRPLVGDIVCFVAGCHSLAVLRSQTQSLTSKFTVVGSCAMWLRKVDEQKFSGIKELLRSSRDFMEIMRELEKKDGWREYDLI